MSPNESNGSDSSAAAAVGCGAIAPETASGLTTSLVGFLSVFASVAGGAGGAAFDSSEPTCSFWYFFRILSLWYLELLVRSWKIILKTN
jgi:hypothetical protein